MKSSHIGKLAAGLLAAVFLLSSCSFDKIRIPGLTGSDGSETAVSGTSGENEPGGSMSDNFTETVSDGLIRLTAAPFPVWNMVSDGEGLLLLQGEPTENSMVDLALLNLKTGSISKGTFELTRSGEYMPFFFIYLVSGHPVILYPDSGSLSCLDPVTFAVTDTAQVTDLFDYCDGTAFGPDCLTVYSYGGNRTSSFTVSAAGTFSHTESTVPLPGEGYEISSVVGAAKENRLIVASNNYRDGTYLHSIVNPDTDSQAVLYFEDGEYFHSLCSGTVITYRYEDNTVTLYPASSPDTMHRIVLPRPSSLAGQLPDANRYLYDAIPDDDTGAAIVERRSLTSGECIASCKLEGHGESQFCIAQEFGDTVMLGFSGGCEGDYYYQIYFWKPDETGTSAVSQNSEAPYPLLMQPSDEQSSRLLIADLENRYNLHIYTGDDAIRYFNGYALVPSYNATDIDYTLRAVQSFLDALPAGFVDELTDTFEGGISLYLTKRIIPDTDNRDSISDAAAFTNTDRDRESIVFDVDSYGIKTTVIHEFMHVIENAINIKARERTDLEQFVRWELLNPKDFLYSGVYTAEDGSTLGYDDNSILGSGYISGNDPDSVWFVDGYSTTYRTEDIARCFEYMFPLEDSEIPEYYNGIHMKEKASYLCACIRDAFDSITDNVTPVWEKAADPAMDLGYFRSSYSWDLWGMG